MSDFAVLSHSLGAETIFTVDKMATSETTSRIVRNQAPHDHECVLIVDTKNVQKCDDSRICVNPKDITKTLI